MNQAFTIEQIVKQAAQQGLVEPEIENLTANVADALRSIIAGERPEPLSSHGLARLGQVVARWDTPYGRLSLGFGASLMAQAMAQLEPAEKPVAPKPRQKLSEGLVEQAGLSSRQADRVEAILRWQIGFTREELSNWGQLSEEELDAVWDYIAREYGFYTTGTLYAAP
jgi:hypothetical protein